MMPIWLCIAFIVGAVLGRKLLGLLISKPLAERRYGVLDSVADLGPAIAVVVALWDAGKVVLLLLLAPLLLSSGDWTDWTPYATAMAAILGHMFSPLAGMKGGKPAAVVLGALLVLMPVGGVIWAVVWVLTAWVSRYSAMASLLAAGVLPLFAVLAGETVADRPMLGFALLVLAMTIFANRPNFREMQLGKEPKLSRASFSKSQALDKDGL